MRSMADRARSCHVTRSHNGHGGDGGRRKGRYVVGGYFPGSPLGTSNSVLSDCSIAFRQCNPPKHDTVDSVILAIGCIVRSLTGMPEEAADEGTEGQCRSTQYPASPSVPLVLVIAHHRSQWATLKSPLQAVTADG